MKALTVIPLKAGSAELSDVDDPPETDGPVLVETLAIGICGTDAEILSGAYGWPPPGRERLVLGHESIGRVLEAPDGAPVKKGDLVVGIVRRPDPVPCANCAVLEWDFCRNGQYTERGIKQHDGYLSERYRITPDFVVKVNPALGILGVLLEPTSVVAKAWEQVDRIGGRAHWEPHTVVVTGAGPIGLLAALIGVQRGYDVHVFDQVKTGLKPDAKGFLTVDAQRRTSVPHLFAIGDIAGQPLLAHKGSKEGIVAAEAIAGKKTIMGALTLYLDFLNLFILLLQLTGNRRQ